MNSEEHNARVRALAERMPDENTRKAVLAIGYTADFGSGTASGFSTARLASMTYGPKRAKRDRISDRSIKRALRALADMGVLKIVHPPANGGKRQPNIYHLDYEWSGDMGKRQRRREREAAKMQNDNDWSDDRIAEEAEAFIAASEPAPAASAGDTTVMRFKDWTPPENVADDDEAARLAALCGTIDCPWAPDCFCFVENPALRPAWEARKRAFPSFRTSNLGPTA